MAAMTICVDVVQWVGNQAAMRKRLVHAGAIASMTVDAEILGGMDDVPLTLVEDGCLRLMTGNTG